MNAIWMGLLNRLMAYLCGQLWDIAKREVALMEAERDLPKPEKRSRVIARLSAAAKEMGMEMADSLINFAIEAALQYLRRRAG